MLPYDGRAVAARPLLVLLSLVLWLVAATARPAPAGPRPPPPWLIDDGTPAWRALEHQTTSEPRPFTFLDGETRWTTTTRSAAGGPLLLTYAFSPLPATVDHLPPNATLAAFRRAFERWARVIPVEITDDADITVGFYEGDHGDGAPFDGPLNVLATPTARTTAGSTSTARSCGPVDGG
jgi:hypothetical protein